MKKYILAAILIGSLTACKGTKEAASASKDNKPVSESNANVKDAVDVNTKNTSDKTDPSGVLSQVNGSTAAMDNIQMSANVSSDDEVTNKEIYENLKMTDEQIGDYEKSIKDFKETVKNNAHGEMMGTIESEEERQLKKILTEDQWNKYREWKKNKE